MALTKTATFKGLSVPSAYFRVWNVAISGSKMTFGIGMHAGPSDEMLDSTAHECAYDLSGPNPIAQAYIHIKSLPEFSGATDC